MPNNNIRNFTFAVYGLYALGTIINIASILGVNSFLPNHILIIIGAILAYVKRQDAEQTIYFSHLQYLLRTFWIALRIVIGFLIIIITMVLLYDYVPEIKVIFSKRNTIYILITNAILIIFHIWWFYRLLFGFTRILKELPIDKAKPKTIN